MNSSTNRTALRTLTALLLTTLSGAAVAGPPTTTQWVLATAKATGAGGEQFESSLRIQNPGSTPATVTLTYLPQSPIDASGSASGDNSGGGITSTVTVPPNQTVALEDVVLSRFSNPQPFGIPAGGIRVVSDVPVSVLSRTFVANGRSSTGAPGTFGFSIPAQTKDEGISIGDTGYLTYISSSPNLTSGFRSNFIMLNTSSTASAAVNVRLQKADGSSIGSKDYTLGRWSAAQVTNIASAFGYTAADTNLTAVVTVTSGGPVIIGASIIDNAISSLNYAPPSKVFIARDGYFGLIVGDGGGSSSYADGYGFGGRIDLSAGKPNLLTAGVVIPGCTVTGEQPQDFLFFIQAQEGTSNQNSTFTRQTDGSYTMTGGLPAQGTAWSATIFFAADGSLHGNLTVVRAASASPCAGRTQTYPFVATRAFAP